MSNIKKLFHLLCIKISLMSSVSLAAENCFILKEGEQIIRQEGECISRQAPCSTFKVAISLMGFNEGILTDENTPKWDFKAEYVDWLDRWKQPHTPKLWLQNSCVWYSQIITEKLGMEKFKKYAKDFHYGNADVSGDIGKNNGLTNAWLSSSIQISPLEQVAFLENLINNKLPVSIKAHEMTKKIMFVENLTNGWKLYGKTGNGSVLSEDKKTKLPRQVGWFVGWIEKDSRKIIFVYRIIDEDKKDTYASLRAKAAAKNELKKLISEQEKN